MNETPTRRAAAVAFDAGWDAHEAFAAPDVKAEVQAAYEAGWADACADWLDQTNNPGHPIGTRKNARYAEEAAR